MSHDESYKLYNQAREFFSNGDFEAAIPLFKQSNKLHTHFKTLELWGECEIKLGNYKQAIMPLTTATELNNSIKPLSLLAQAYKKIGEQTKAVELAQKVLSSAPNNKTAKGIINGNN